MACPCGALDLTCNQQPDISMIRHISRNRCQHTASAYAFANSLIADLRNQLMVCQTAEYKKAMCIATMVWQRYATSCALARTFAQCSSCHSLHKGSRERYTCSIAVASVGHIRLLIVTVVHGIVHLPCNIHGICNDSGQCWHLGLPDSV